MKVSNQSTITSSQKILIGAKSQLLKPLLAIKLKRHINTAETNLKINQKVLTSKENDKENVLIEKNESVLLEASKKIRKISIKRPQQTATRKTLNDITNTCESFSVDQITLKKNNLQKSFLEDERKQTSNYVTLSYINTHTRKDYRFYCFHDHEMDIPSEYAAKTITHSCDNDCTSDEDQIRGAIKNMFKSLENHLKEQKEVEKLLKKP